MKAKILAGKKTMTTRDHPLPLEDVQAVSGSRYSAEQFAILRIEGRAPTTIESVAHYFYQEEGFDSEQEMNDFIDKKMGRYRTAPALWRHKFTVIEPRAKPQREAGRVE